VGAVGRQPVQPRLQVEHEEGGGVEGGGGVAGEEGESGLVYFLNEFFDFTFIFCLGVATTGDINVVFVLDGTHKIEVITTIPRAIR
jgi:hypothetical protein